MIPDTDGCEWQREAEPAYAPARTWEAWALLGVFLASVALGVAAWL